MTTMPPSMAAAERYLALLQQDTHQAGVYLDQLTEDASVDAWAIVEHLGHKLTRPAPKPARPTARTDDDPLQVAADTRSVWNEALGAAGVFRYR